MVAQRLTLARWTALCAAAEAIGMTAAAAAAKTSQALVGEPGDPREAAIAISLVVCGGLVEGVALGGLQAVGLGRLLPGLNRRRWLLVTATVAGVGWAAAPATLSGESGGGAPPLLLVLSGAVVLGALMGGALGAVQATVLRGQVRHPWRWVGASTAAWAPAMAVIFAGATAPDAGWPAPAVVALGTVTGLTAGTVLGLVSGWFLPCLDGPPPHNRLVLSVLGSPAHGVLSRSMVALRVRGAVTGRTFELPVQYAVLDGGISPVADTVNHAGKDLPDATSDSTADSTSDATANVPRGAAVVVVPGRPEAKRWWRNLVEPAPVDVLLRGHWLPGDGIVLRPGDPGYDVAIGAYRQRWPPAGIPRDSPLVLVRCAPVSPAAARTRPTPPA